MKSFFMDELQTIKHESLTSVEIQNTSTNIDHGTVDSLQTKIKLLEIENNLLKDDVKNKQKLIDYILEHNSNVIQAQNVFAQNTLSLERQMIKVLVISLEKMLFEMAKKFKRSNVPKDDKFKELQVSFKDFHPKAHHQPKIKKSFVAIEDSTIKNVNGSNASRGHPVKV